MVTTDRACGLCDARASWVCRQKLLGRHEVDYFLCPRCDLLQTQSPYWLDEAYSRAITTLDTGAIERNQADSRITLILSGLLGVGPGEPCLDFGGGHGVFARMMRDLGLDFRWYDKHAQNLFAAGFEGELATRYRLVTAFEVFEHLAETRADLSQIFGPRHDYIFVATLLHAGHQAGLWYYMLESGQHVTFYSQRTMAFIAEMFGYDAVTGPTHTLFIRRDLTVGSTRRALLRQGLRRPGLAAGLASLIPEALFHRYRSRVQPDHEAVRGKCR
jgi:2-polyprenyl-3-methyl-5-hydroxy-6-metoxy-1,4-benzoquinol methylase